jgi:uncharacterized protein YggE
MFVVVPTVILAMTVATARAEAAPEGIAVSGTGTVKAKPSVVELGGTVSGEAELANDASVKYHDTKKKAVAAFEALKNPDLSVEFDGSAVTQGVDSQAQMRMMQGMGNENVKSKVQVSEQLHLVLKNVDKLDADKLLETLFKIIDTGRDAGVQIGPPMARNYYEMQIRSQNGGEGAMVQFKIPDITELQNQAYKLAVADARAKAERLAQLSGVKLGRVLSVQDQGSISADSAANVSYRVPNSNEGEHATSPKEAVSGHAGEIPIAVRVQVVFEIAK